MDSRSRGNDVISARHVIFTLAVIPAKLVSAKAGTGIHFGQRIPKLEVRRTTADPSGELEFPCYSTVNGGAREISPRAFSRAATRPKMPARKNFITTITRVANSSMCA